MLSITDNRTNETIADSAQIYIPIFLLYGFNTYLKARCCVMWKSAWVYKKSFKELSPHLFELTYFCDCNVCVETKCIHLLVLIVHWTTMISDFRLLRDIFLTKYYIRVFKKNCLVIVSLNRLIACYWEF